MFRTFLKMNEAGAEGTGGGTITPAPASALGLSTPVVPLAQPPQFIEEGWLKGLESEVALDPSLKDIKDLPNLAKSYVNAQKLIGRDKIALPSEFATPAEWQSVYEKLGVPKDVEGYKFKEKFDSFDDNYIKDFKAFAKDSGLLPHQAEKVLAKIRDEDAAMEKATEESYAQARSDAMADLGKTYGAALDTKLQSARSALTKIANPEMLAYVEESGLSNDPQFIKFLVNIGDKFFSEDSTNPPAGSYAMTPNQAKDEINAIMGDMKHPYFNSSHPGNEAAVQHMLKLHGYAVAGQK